MIIQIIPLLLLLCSCVIKYLPVATGQLVNKKTHQSEH